MSATLKIVKEMILNSEEFIVHCRTEKMRRDFFEYIDTLGVVWKSGRGMFDHLPNYMSFRVKEKKVTEQDEQYFREGETSGQLPQFIWSEVLDNSFKIAFDEGEFEKILGV